MLNHVITISREFGSGGRELGKRLSEKLDIPFYDKELISLTAQEAALSETELLHYYESIPVMEQSTQPSVYPAFSPLYDVPISDQVFLAQSRVIKSLADQGPCIIVGRCADRVLEDSINLFVYAEIEQRVKRILSLNKDIDPDIIENKIRETDRKRKDYYQYYTGCEWGKAQNYHLCLDSGFAGVSACLQAVLSYLEHCI